ncbi:MAG: hypothetical protein Q9218_007852 [Villophora microphyllina]
MFIIDEIHYQPPKEPDFNVMGGGGLYAALGARLFRPPPASSKVGWVVHQGHDFPPRIEERIDSWNTNCQLIKTPDRPTTRAYNKYEPNGYRSFHYLNEKIRINENTLTTEQLTSKTYHLLCSSSRAIDLVKGIKARRKTMAESLQPDDSVARALEEEPLFVWEPMPDLCKPAEYPSFMDALQYINVFSPNLDEFGSLLGIDFNFEEPSSRTLLHRKLRHLIEYDAGDQRFAVVVRLGQHGCCMAQAGRVTHLPAYHEQSDSNRVVDPTGGGNTFLGGFCAGYLQSPSVSWDYRFEEALLYGTVAASFAIEQVGVPILTHSAAGEELWNGVSVETRLIEYKERVGIDNHALKP